MADLYTNVFGNRLHLVDWMIIWKIHLFCFLKLLTSQC